MELLEYLQENFPLISFVLSAILDLILGLLIYKRTGKIKTDIKLSQPQQILQMQGIQENCIPVKESDMIDKTISYHQQCIRDLQSVKVERYGNSNSE